MDFLRIRKTRLHRIERSGWWVILAALVLGMAAVNSGNNVLYWVDGLLLAAIIASGQISRRGLRSLAVRVHAPGTVWSDRLTRMRLTLQNHSRVWFLLGLEVFVEWTRLAPKIGAPRPTRSAGYRMRSAIVRPGHKRRVNLAWAFTGRGRYRLSRVYIGTRGPFGWFYRWSWVVPDVEVLVYPPRWPRWQERWLALARSTQDQPPRAVLEGDDFYGLREYQNGDPVRTIHWPTSARVGRWMVRQPGQQRENVVWFWFDRRITPADLEVAVSWTATGLWTLYQQHLQVGLVTQGWGPELIRSHPALRQAMEFLAVCTPATTPLPTGATGPAGFWISDAQPPPDSFGNDVVWITPERMRQERVQGYALV